MRYSKYRDYPKEYDALVAKMSGCESGEFKEFYEENKEYLETIDISSYSSFVNQVMVRMDRIRVVERIIRGPEGHTALPGQYIHTDDFRTYFGKNNSNIYNKVFKGYVSKIKIVNPDELAAGKWGEPWINQ